MQMRCSFFLSREENGCSVFDAMDDGFVFVQTLIKPQQPEKGIGFRPVLLYTVTRKTKLDKAACAAMNNAAGMN